MRVALGIEYCGTNYHGWQRQKSGIATVQDFLEIALSKVANHPIQIFCAGRTDAGVHAKEQVVHFDTEADRDLKAWVLGGNANLPSDIKVIWAQEVSKDFHARFSAVARRYRYLLHNTKIKSAIYSKLVSWHSVPLDANLMHQAGQYLIGKRDFSSFRGADCQSKSANRNVHYLKVTRKGGLVVIDIKANAFLMHMVRNIVGVLIEVGEGRRDPIWANEVLEQRTRTAAGITAPANGLYLMKVYYETGQ